MYGAPGDANKTRPFAEPQRGRLDEAKPTPKLSLGGAGGERALDFVRRQRPDGDGDAPIAEIALRVEVAGRRALDRRMAGNVDCVGDQRRGGVGARGRSREDRDRVGDAKRETAPSPARRRDAAHAIRSADRGAAEQARPVRAIDHADRERLTWPKVKRDVAAVVDIGAGEPPSARHGLEDLFGHRAGDRGHRGDEAPRKEGRNRRRHPSRDRTPRGGAVGARLRPQQGQLRAELVEDRREAAPRRDVGGFDRARLAKGFNDEVDRSVVQMQTAVGKTSLLRRRSHALRLVPAARATAPLVKILFGRSACCATTSSSGRTSSTWPPSAA